MNSFVIGGTDFGVDSAATVARVTTRPDGSRVLNLDTSDRGSNRLCYNIGFKFETVY